MKKKKEPKTTEKQSKAPKPKVAEPLVHCPFDAMVPVTELKFHPDNANVHPEEQVERLAEIIAFQGWRYFVKVSKRSGFVTSGHGRIMAARLRGWTQVPVSYQAYDSEAQEFADVQADNAIASWSELDMGLINKRMESLKDELDEKLLGLRAQLMPEIEKLAPGCDEDDAPAPRPDPKTRRGDVYRLGEHMLVCGDSTKIDEVRKMMGDEQVDMVWTDPPYNVAYEGKTKDALTIENDAMGDTAFYQFLYDAYTTMLMVTKPGGAIYVAHADSEGANFRRALKDAGWLLKQCLVWVKQTLVMGRQDYHWRHEPILYGWAPGASHNWYSDRKQTTVLEFNRPSRNIEHPTMKPVELVEYMLGNSSAPGALVFDPFGGSGTTLIACEKTGRRARLCELDPRYCDVIVERFEKYTGRKAELISHE